MFEFKENCVVSIIGPRGSGKSFLNKKLLTSEFNDFDTIIIFCPSLDVNDDYYGRELTQMENIYYVNDFNEDDLEAVFQDQYRCKKSVVANRRNKILQRQQLECPRLLVVMDDVIDSGVIRFGGVVDKYAERGRHIDITCLICTQRMSALSRSVRINSDYIFLFAPFSISEIERFCEEFVSRSQRKSLHAALDQVYKIPHEFVMVDNSVKDPRGKLKHTNAQDLLKGVVHPIVLTEEAVPRKPERPLKKAKKEKRPKMPEVEELPNKPAGL